MSKRLRACDAAGFSFVAGALAAMWLANCARGNGGAMHAQIAIHGVSQALSSSPLAAFTLASATLTITCDSGEQQSATGTLTDPIKFSPVDACGRATLALTILVQTAAGAVTGYLGATSAMLSAGEVDVVFSGTLAGETAFSSSDGESFVCSGAGTNIEVPASGAIIALPAGTYTLSCNGSGGASFTTPLVVNPGTRAPLPLPPPLPAVPASLSSLSVSAVGFKVSNALVFDPATTDYSLTVPIDTTELSVAATPSPASATVSVNGVDGVPATLDFSTDSQDVVVAAQGASAAYTIHVTRGQLADNALLSALSILSSIELTLPLTPAFSPTQFSYTITAPAGTPSISIVLSPADRFATATISPGADLPLVQGHNPMTIHVVAADGFTFNDYALDAPQAATDVHDATLSFLATGFGRLTPAFSPANTNPYAVYLSSRRATVSLTAIPAQAAATTSILINAEPIPLDGNITLGIPGFADVTDNAFSVTVTAPDGTTTQSYPIIIWRGLIQTLTAPGLDFFDASLPFFSMTTSTSSGNVSVASTAGATVMLTLNGENIESGASTPVATPSGVSFATVGATTLDGEVDSYGLQFINGTPFYEAAFLSPATNTLSLMSANAISLLNGGGIVTLDTSTACGVSNPNQIVASVNGDFVYFSGDQGIGWAALDQTNALSTGPVFGTVLGHVSLTFGKGTALAADPQGRFIYALDGTTIDTFAIQSDGTLALIHQTVDLSATALAVDGPGRFVFIASGDEIQDYEVAADGSLDNQLSSTATTSGLPAIAMAADQSGAFLYYIDAQGAYAVPVQFSAYGSLDTPVASANPVAPSFVSPIALAVSGGTNSETGNDEVLVVDAGSGNNDGAIFPFHGTTDGPPFLYNDTPTTGLAAPSAAASLTPAATSTPTDFYVNASTLIGSSDELSGDAGGSSTTITASVQAMVVFGAF